MNWTNDDDEARRALRLIDFTIVQPTSPSGIVRMRCAPANGGADGDIWIRLNPAQARDLAQDLLKLALESEATLFDAP